MKTPTWVIVVAILMMLFGGCGVLNNIQNVNAPEMIEMQKQIIKDSRTDRNPYMEQDSQEEGESLSEYSLEEERMRRQEDKVEELFDSMLHMSDFTKTWVVKFGYIGIFVCLFYVLGGALLLTKKKFSLPLAYVALGVSMAFSIVRMVVLMSDSSGLMGMSFTMNGVFGLLADLGLLIAILACDKAVFKGQVAVLDEWDDNEWDDNEWDS